VNLFYKESQKKEKKKKRKERRIKNRKLRSGISLHSEAEAYI
jgi:hypothetical protein